MPEFPKALKEADESIERQARRFEQLGTESWNNWKRADDLQKKAGCHRFHSRKAASYANRYTV